MPTKEFYQKNKETYLKRQKNFYKNHKEQIKEQAKIKYHNMSHEEKNKKSEYAKKLVQ